MGSFSDSFVEAANRTAPIAASAQFDLIKEKIKKDADIAESNKMINNVQAAIAERFKDKPDIANSIIAVTDKLRGGKIDSSALKTTLEIVAPEAMTDPSLLAQRQATTALNEATSFLMQDAIKRSGINPSSPMSQNTSTAEPSSPLVTKLPLGRGGEMIMPDAMAKANELEAYATGKGTGRASNETEQSKLATKLGNLGKKLNTLRKQYDEALPAAIKEDNKGLYPKNEIKSSPKSFCNFLAASSLLI
jgi:hypothetical protein